MLNESGNFTVHYRMWVSTDHHSGPAYGITTCNKNTLVAR